MRNLENEIWLPVVGYEGLYEVSNLGRVKSTYSWRGSTKRVLKAGKNKYGYLIVNLCKDGKMKTHYVHRLVAAAFLPNPHNLPEVNHTNEVKDDNRASNLEFCTAEYNNNYGTRNERMAKSKSKPVLQLTFEGKLVKEWSSVMEAQRLGGFHHGNISSCCSGKYKSHGGYVWRYKE